MVVLDAEKTSEKGVGWIVYITKDDEGEKGEGINEKVVKYN